jgi:phosphate starvation-inducible PhoH-like protein
LSEIILTIQDIDPVELYGEKNKKLNLVKNAFPEVKFTSRGSSLKLVGDRGQTQKVKSKIELMVRLLKDKRELSTQTIEDVLNGANPFDNQLNDKVAGGKNTIVYGRGGKPIKPRTKNQKKLVDLADKNDIVFAIGPAGTGKTYTGVALAVKALKNKLVKKIILTRPAVEAGENLGFLPGDLNDKVDPYLRPLYDALHDMIDGDKLKFFMQNRIIEVAPLAFMRGRTLDNSFIILDEAQNCTSPQIKMFLTRLGPNAKCIITGDPSQIDLPHRQKSGLFTALDILGDVKGIGRVNLSTDDVVRHRLVKEIIKRYNAHSPNKEKSRYKKEEE